MIMKRRNTLMFLGGLVNGGFLYKYYNRPSLAVNYDDFIMQDEISIDTTSGEIGSLIIRFDKLNIIGNNIPESEITLNIYAEINNKEKNFYSNNLNIENGNINKNIDDIEVNLLENDFKISDLNTPEEISENSKTNIDIKIRIENSETFQDIEYIDDFTVDINKINATLFSTGTIKIRDEGEIIEDVGFDPDYLEFTSFQQIAEISDGNNGDNYFEYYSGRNNNCNSNENGWSLGAAIKRDNSVKQRCLSAARNSDSTNGHRVASSTEYVVNHIYVDREGELCSGDSSRLQCKISEFTDNGFKMEVDTKNFDEEITYRAFSIGEGKCDIGFHKIDEQGNSEIDCGFKPNLLNLRAGQQITSNNFEQTYNQNDGIATDGTSQGKCIIDDEDNIKQYCASTGESSDSTNSHISVMRDDLIINNIYVDQDAGVNGRLECVIDDVTQNGIVIKSTNTHDSDSLYSPEIILYRAFELPDDIEVDIGVKKITDSGKTSINDIGFKASNIDVVSYQHVSELNQEYNPSPNQGNENANGYSEGWISGSVNSIESISVGRTSDSQDAHRTRSSLTYLINNVYVDNDGDIVGEQQIKPLELTEQGLEIDVEKYHTDELILYQAINDI